MSEHIPEAPPHPHGLAATLQKKVIGPVPLWLVIGIGGGVLLLLVRHGKGGASTPDPTQDAASGAVDAAGGDPGGASAGGVGSIDGGPTGNMGGVEDPMPPGIDSGFDFGDPGISSSPPADDPVVTPGDGMIPMIGGGSYSPGWENPDVQSQLFQIGSEYARTHPNWADPGAVVAQSARQSPIGTTFGGWTVVGSDGGGFAQVGGSRRLSALVHPMSSPAGRIAAVTTPFSVGPTQDTVHVSSAATGARGVYAE